MEEPKPPSFSKLMEMIGNAELDNKLLEYVRSLELFTKERYESVNPDVLANRYATETKDIFSEKGKTKSERALWVAVMKAQRDLGVEIPGEDIAKYEAVVDDIDLDFIRERERQTKHDVKAKIEAFVKAAGAKQHVHRAMTSRDLTDNVEQMQIKQASELILSRYISVLYRMAERATMYRDILLTARTHHQPAQPTLLGRRITMSMEEIMLHWPEFEDFVAEYPLRGMKGPVGTQSDMLALLGSPEKVQELERRIAGYLGFSNTLTSVGQVYPRSLDSSLASKLSALSAGCENFAKNMRLMSGYELVTEGFDEGQTGSSAMPHKMNTRSCERICGFSELLKMYADGASRISGDQWEEGDVSESVVRRIVIPSVFYASDGLCETMLTVLKNMDAYPDSIQGEMQRYAPFLATTQFITAATKSGIGREDTHEIIKKHAISEIGKLRRGETAKNEFIYRLAEDPTFAAHGLTYDVLNGILRKQEALIGDARGQTDSIIARIGPYASSYPEAVSYIPRPIL